MESSLRAAREDLGRGRLDEAEKGLRRALGARPDDPEALHLLGLVAHRRGDLRAAAELLARSAERSPAGVEVRAHLAEVLRAGGRLAEAEAAARAALALDPRSVAALNNLGLTLQDQGRLVEAEESLRAAVAADRNQARARYNLGNVLRAQGRMAEAEETIRAALRSQPKYPQALNALGVVQQARGDLAGAAATFERAIAMAPGYAKPLVNRGALLAALGRPAEALECFDRALAVAPDSVEALGGRADALLELGRAEEAQATLARAQRVAPAHAPTAMRIGAAHQRHFDFASAERAYSRALELDPGHEEALAGQVACRAQLCDWRDREQGIARLREVVARRVAAGEGSPVSPSMATILGFDGVEQLAIARITAQGFLRHAARLPEEPHPPPPMRRRIRLAYLSSDFRDNALAHLTRGMYGRHDRERFEVLGYSIGPDDGSDYRRDIAASCDRFVDLAALPPVEAARRIREDDVDILIDLTGFAAGSRPAILAARPAPVQAVYLYPGTLGGIFTDYFIGDPVITPPAHQPLFGERLAILPRCYQVNDDAQPIADQRFERASQGLPDDAVVLCSFNNHWKIEPRIWDVWMRILGRVPHAVLWLQDMAAPARANLRREAESRGVREDRLVFAPYLPKPVHLARAGLADLFLDTVICNAHTSASDALWAGVPLITCPGAFLPTRVAASLLQAAGVPELVMPDLATYEEETVRVATDRAALGALRERIAAARSASPLFDTTRTTRALERAYLLMWEHHRAGETPAPIVVEESA